MEELRRVDSKGGGSLFIIRTDADELIGTVQESRQIALSTPRPLSHLSTTTNAAFVVQQ